MKYEYDETQQTVVHKVVRPSDVYWEPFDKAEIKALLKTWKIVDFRPIKLGDQFISCMIYQGVYTCDDYHLGSDKKARFIVIPREQPIDFPEWE